MLIRYAGSLLPSDRLHKTIYTLEKAAIQNVSCANDRSKSHSGHFPILMLPTALAEHLTIPVRVKMDYYNLS